MSFMYHIAVLATILRMGFIIIMDDDDDIIIFYCSSYIYTAVI